MKITVKIGEVLDVPITECKYTLIKNFATTNDNKILLTLKFLAELSKEVTYKEIYFTLLTFDVLHYIDETPNELKNKIKKYEEKYNYSREKIAEKRKEKSSASVFFVHINRSAAQNSSFLFHSETVPKTQLEKL